jgi:hypothetical protein
VPFGKNANAPEARGGAGETPVEGQGGGWKPKPDGRVPPGLDHWGRAPEPSCLQGERLWGKPRREAIRAIYAHRLQQMFDGAVASSLGIIDLLFKARDLYVSYGGIFDWKLFYPLCVVGAKQFKFRARPRCDPFIEGVSFIIWTGFRKCSPYMFPARKLSKNLVIAPRLQVVHPTKCRGYPVCVTFLPSDSKSLLRANTGLGMVTPLTTTSDDSSVRLPWNWSSGLKCSCSNCRARHNPAASISLK